MPIKRGEIYLFIGFEAEKFSPKMLSRKDRRKLKKYPNFRKGANVAEMDENLLAT